MDTPNPSLPQATTADLQAEVAALRAKVKLAHYLGLGLTVAVALLVYRIDQFQSRNIENQMALTAKLQEDQARMTKVVGELQKFGATHPDYAAILKKYGVDPAPGTNAPAPATPAAAQPKR